jgi:DNA topoisomerase IA
VQEESDEQETDLPLIREGEMVKYLSSNILEKKTKPPVIMP